MKKIFLICFTLIASTLLFCACHTESMEGIVNAKGNLSLSSMKVGVNLDVDVVYLDSRAESEIDLSNYIVTIYDKYSQRAGQWVYSEMPEIVSLAVGTYTVEVKSAAEPSNGFDIPYYKGTATCEVKENQVTEGLEISCKLANMLFTVEYDESFQDKISEDVVTTITIGENSLQIPASESRKAYLIAPDSETASMEVSLKGTIDGEVIDYSEHFDDVKSGVHNIIKYQFIPVSDGSVAGGAFSVSIAIDSSLTASDESVSVNPGPEPGIDDFPTGGGEGDNLPTIVGTYFNGNSFDISNDVLEVPTSTNENNPLPLQVTLSAANGIAHVFVTIDSETLTEELLTDVGLAASFDLAEPGELENGLQGLGFPTGEAVVGQTEILFDVTKFTPLLGIYGVASHNFIIRLVDQQGLEVTQTLKIKSVK
ncbi:DUF4493 domain-containing protein [Phocaeicola plebeius]|uniref:DUF4493 domain-containing protein n=1 Tax=Phocaeicola plebeius TaxID=310297 RepID=UPI00307EB9B1